MSDTIEALRARFLYARNAITGTQRALEATPEYRAHQEALEHYFAAEEAFAGHGGTCEYAGFCEYCGIPLKGAEADTITVSYEGDHASVCKDAAACLARRRAVA